MPDKPATQKQLLLELEDLRARLDEAEETLRAVRSGEVDALVVSGAAGEQLFTLKGADRSYRLLIEDMNEGALTLTAEGVILYANQRLGEMLKTPLEKVIGSSIHTWIAPDSEKTLQLLLRQDDMQPRRRGEVMLLASDGTLAPGLLSINLLRIDEMQGFFCMVATDLTEQKHTEAIIASEKLARELLAASNQSRRALLSVIEDQKLAEAALEHANRALATLSAVNRNLVHATSEDELLRETCLAIVRQRGYRMAWVGYVQHDENKSIKVMARAGHDDGYLDAIQNTWAESERGMGPGGRAIRGGATQLCQDIANDQLFRPWREAALKRGYAAKIALPLLNADNAVFGVLHVYSSEVNAFIPAEIALLEEMAGDLAFGVGALHTRHERDLALERNRQQLAQLEDSLEDTVRAIATIVEMRDPYTSGHQLRVAELAATVAKKLGLPDAQAHAIHLAGVVHDLGKIQVPAEILSKPGKLNDIEYMMIKMHPQAGYDILKGIDFPWPIAQMVLQHHERLDGSGYPQGIKGDQIILEARILSVADVVEAMSSFRPYRPGLGIEAALDEIIHGRGTLFDAQVVDACVALFREQNYVLPN